MQHKFNNQFLHNIAKKNFELQINCFNSPKSNSLYCESQIESIQMLFL